MVGLDENDILTRLKILAGPEPDFEKNPWEYGWLSKSVHRDVLIEAANEIERLREGLRLIACEPINAEYMAQKILDGLPAYHGAGFTHNAQSNPRAENEQFHLRQVRD